MIRAATTRQQVGDTASSPPWHALGWEEAVRRLDSDDTRGLGEDDATRRLALHGPNELRIQGPRPWWLLLVDQLRSVVVALLVVAALAAFALGERLEAAAIGLVLAFNVAIGFWLEWRARVAMAALSRLETPHATVVRDGVEREIEARQLVPGDLLALAPGDSVPADGRLIEATELQMVEAPLTGESEPVSKTEASTSDPTTPLAERTSMVYKGTVVADGEAWAVVVATGRETEIGRIGELVASTREERTPLEKRLDQLGRRLVWLTLAVAAVVALSGLARGRETWLMIETALALAIAAVPEGLPAVTTMTLALGMRRMARRRALVRRLPAVETLGSVTVLCTDKTGTLTRGEMTAAQLQIGDRCYHLDHPASETVLLEGHEITATDDPTLALAASILALANTARVETGPQGQRLVGDPTETALLVAATRAGVDRQQLRLDHPEVSRVPFSSDRRLMATIHRWRDGHRVMVKGAPDRILLRSTRRLGDDGPLGGAERDEVLAQNRRLAGQGLRVLALAYRDLPAGDDSVDEPETALEGLTFVGLVGLHDPLAPGVSETVQRLREAGIRVLMVTGDQRATAEAIAAEAKLLGPEDRVVDATEIGIGDSRVLASRLDRVAGLARISPADKLKVVEALQQRGEIVGMLGDGVNDAPALKRADIGVAMGGRGTDVAKESADLVLQDDRLETVAAAVEEGRVIFDNLRKFIFYLFSCNLSEVSVLLVAGLAGLPLPLLPLQILWLNLVTDVFPAFALAVEPAEPGVMKRPPRSPRAAILSRSFLASVGGHSVLITAATLGAYLTTLSKATGDPGHAVTVAFMTLAFAQLFHVFNARALSPVLFSRRLFANVWVWAATGLTVGLQLMAVYHPGLSRVLRTHHLDGSDWLLILACSLGPLLLGQAWKLAHRSRHAL